MIDKRLVLVLLFISQFAFSQINGVVKDSLTGNPIPYVNIWVENMNIGTTSDENGTFVLNVNENKRVVFSVLGYEKKITLIKNKATIFLKGKVFELDEVVISNPKKTITLEIGDAKKIQHTHLSGDKPWIYAKMFPFEERFTSTPFVNKIEFFSKSTQSNAKLKIRVYSFKDSVPNDDLVYEDIVVSVKKGMNKNTVDVSKYKIKFPTNGIVIGLEWLIIEENKYIFEFKDTATNSNKTYVTYNPSLVINYSDIENSFRYSAGKWNKSIRNKSSFKKNWDNKIMTPAINLILSN